MYSTYLLFIMSIFIVVNIALSIPLASCKSNLYVMHVLIMQTAQEVPQLRLCQDFGKIMI